MTKLNTLLNLSLFVMGMTLLPQAAFSQDKPGVTGVTELVMTDILKGNGAEATVGSMAEVHYTGWLFDPSGPLNKGKKFDSSRDRSGPFSFLLGAGRVIKGWDKGVVGMKIGGRRILIVPPSMAYGSTGAGGVIPANATLIFDIELLSLRQGPTH